MVAAGLIVAVIAVYLVVSAILGLLIWAAFLGVLVLAVVVAVRLTRASAATTPGRDRGRSRGTVDCAGETLRAGDAVRAGPGFDGPVELAFGRGEIVRLTRRTAHVRFDDRPARTYQVVPGALRRLG